MTLMLLAIGTLCGLQYLIEWVPQSFPPNANGLMIAEVTFYGTKMIYQSVEGNEVMQSLIVSSEWWGHNRVSFALPKGQEISEYSFSCLQFPFKRQSIKARSEIGEMF